MSSVPTTTRMEAIAEIERTRANFFSGSGMFAVVRAYQLPSAVSLGPMYRRLLEEQHAEQPNA